MEEQVTDTQTAAAPDTQPAQETQAPSEPAQTTEAYVPFSAGKEKFKINGQEEEWDWETTKRYAQLGKAGQRAMQEKAESERKQKDFFSKLVQGLESDPAATYEALTGKKPSFSVQRAEQAAAGQEQDSHNPLELRLRQTEERLQNLLQQQESVAVDQERQLVEKELSDASAKFPEINTPWLKSYVKQQYKALLQQGVYDMSIDDVAFMVAEDVKKQNAEKQKTLVQQVDKNKERAVVSAPRGTGQESKKPMSLDDVKRLAGRQV
jgi:hypothetical protein